MLKLQVLVGDQWGTLNRLSIGASATADAQTRATTELLRIQAAWAANYDRFRGSDVKFRIVQE